LLVTELVTNSFKYAFPDGRMGEIHMTLRQDPPGTCILTVGDTGVGLPEGLDVYATESLGRQLIRLLMEQLGGTIALEGHGETTVTMTFPLRATSTRRGFRAPEPIFKGVSLQRRRVRQQ
jgi:two-component sensor histidine kinase